MSETIGAKLKILRKGRKLSQQDLAAQLDLTRATISNHEIGRRTPHLKDLKRYADFYGVSLDYFGIVTTDEVFELISRAKKIFENDDISSEKKEELYKEVMKLYLKISK